MILSLAMNFPQTELDLPTPLPDWEAMPKMRRGMLSITDRGDQRRKGRKLMLPLGGTDLAGYHDSNNSTVKFEVTFMEPCDNETHCYELMNRGFIRMSQHTWIKRLNLVGLQLCFGQTRW